MRLVPSAGAGEASEVLPPVGRLDVEQEEEEEEEDGCPSISEIYDICRRQISCMISDVATSLIKHAICLISSLTP